MKPKICEAEGCGKPAVRVIDNRDFCGEHRHVRHEPPIAVCSVDGCGLPAEGRANGLPLCHFHRPRLAA